MNRLVGAAVVGALLSVGHAGSARASDEVLVSNTGRGFSGRLTEPLFDPALRWVPGDVRSATFYVRNDGADPAGLSLTVVDEKNGELLDSGALDVQVSSGDTRWSSDPRLPSRTVRSGVPLAPGTSAPVKVRVAFDPAATNRTQLLSGELRLRVRLTQSLNGTGPRPAPGGDLLPDTGAPAGLTWLLVLGSLSLGTGSALVTRHPHHHGDIHDH